MGMDPVHWLLSSASMTSGGCLIGATGQGGTPSRTYMPLMTVTYTSPRQPQADHGSSSQKAHANGRTIASHDGFQEHRHEVGALFSTVNQVQNYDVYYRRAGACGLPPGGQSTDCGLYPATGASLECQGTDDFLPMCWGNSGFCAKASEAEYQCHVALQKGAASTAMESPLSLRWVDTDDRHSSSTTLDASGVPVDEMVEMHPWGHQV
jgi:hypothetical protein